MFSAKAHVGGNHQRKTLLGDDSNGDFMLNCPTAPILFCLPVNGCQGRAETEGEQSGEEAEGDENTRCGDTNHAQLALLEVWVGLPGYWPTRGRTAAEEAAAELAKLRKALKIDVGPAMSSADTGGAEHGAGSVVPASTLQVHKPGSCICRVFEGVKRKSDAPVVRRLDAHRYWYQRASSERDTM